MIDDTGTGDLNKKKLTTMFTYNTSGEFEKFKTITNEGFTQGQSIGAIDYIFLFEENDIIYCLKQTPKGDKVAPCTIKKTDNVATFSKYARIQADDSLEDATFSITSQSNITNEATAKKVAEMALEFLNK